MTESSAQDFAAKWIDDWNRHDLTALLEHYADDVEYASPFVAQLGGAADGTLYDRTALEDYFVAALAKYPDLQFKLLEVFVGVNSLVLRYRSVNNLLAAEVMLFDAEGKICRLLAHYAS